LKNETRKIEKRIYLSSSRSKRRYINPEINRNRLPVEDLTTASEQETSTGGLRFGIGKFDQIIPKNEE